jgi:hypothetical protein
LLPHEHQRLLDEVRRQPGVFMVTDHLHEHMSNGEFAIDTGHSFRSAGRSAWGTTGRVAAGLAGGALLIWGIRERKVLGEFGAAIVEEFQRAMGGMGGMGGNLREGFDSAKQKMGQAGESMSEMGQSAARKMDEGLEWAESASSDVIEDYAQKRRRPNVADATH